MKKVINFCESHRQFDVSHKPFEWISEIPAHNRRSNLKLIIIFWSSSTIWAWLSEFKKFGRHRWNMILLWNVKTSTNNDLKHTLESSSFSFKAYDKSYPFSRWMRRLNAGIGCGSSLDNNFFVMWSDGSLLCCTWIVSYFKSSSKISSLIVLKKSKLFNKYVSLPTDISLPSRNMCYQNDHKRIWNFELFSSFCPNKVDVLFWSWCPWNIPRVSRNFCFFVMDERDALHVVRK